MLSDPPCTCGRDESKTRTSNDKEEEEEKNDGGLEGMQRRRRLGHNTTCAALDAPGTTFIIIVGANGGGVTPNPDAAVIAAALNRVFDPSAIWAPRGVEAVVLLPASAPDALETRVFSTLKRTEGVVSYRNEPFERTSLIRSPGDVVGAEAADVDAAVRMAAGAEVAVWHLRREPQPGEPGTAGTAGIAGIAGGTGREPAGTGTGMRSDGDGDGSGATAVAAVEEDDDAAVPPLPPPPPSVPRASLLAEQASQCWRDGALALAAMRRAAATRGGSGSRAKKEKGDMGGGGREEGVDDNDYVDATSDNNHRDHDDADDDVKITFIVQYYKRPALVPRIVAGLAAGARAALGRGGKWEVLVANDGGGGDDGAAWTRALRRVSNPVMRWRVVHAGNLHEIRTYARLSRLASGASVVFMQDDDVPPSHGRWIRQSLALFRRHPRLALLGGYTGKTAGGPKCGKYGLDAKGVYGGRERHKMPTSDVGGPFMFHAQLNMGPFIFRRDALRHMGGPQMGFSCRGESGIGFDYELSLRVWYYGGDATTWGKGQGKGH